MSVDEYLKTWDSLPKEKQKELNQKWHDEEIRSEAYEKCHWAIASFFFFAILICGSNLRIDDFADSFNECCTALGKLTLLTLLGYVFYWIIRLFKK